jgi:hypothetical protein
MNRLAWGACAGTALWAAACGSSVESGQTITCGSGTHQDGSECVPNRGTEDAAARDAVAGGDAPRATDSASQDSAPPDAGTPVMNGDPCPEGHSDVCYQDHIYGCQLVANGDGHPVGTLWYDPSTGDCTLLGGKCLVPPVSMGAQGRCVGGGYTTCTPMFTDAGNMIEERRCYSTGVAEYCNGSTWEPLDCAGSGLVCGNVDAGIACVPP